MGGLVKAIFGGGDSAPAPDPAIGQAAAANAEIGREALAFNKDQFYNYVKPRQEKQDLIAEQIVRQQMGIADKQEGRADEAQAFYKETFQPIERQVASDAMGYDSEARIAQQRGIASTDVTRAFANTRAQNNRSMAMMGINPNSTRFAANNLNSANAEALGKASAVTKAGRDVEDKAIALRAGAANFGRNMPNTAASAYGASVASGSSAAGVGANNNAAGIATLGVMNQGYSTGMAGNSSQASILNGLYGNQLSAFNAEQQMQAAQMQAIGSIAGGFAAKSSKKYKENKKPMDSEAVADKVASMPVEKWDYKKGIADSGTHIGPYAEDFSKNFGGPSNSIDLITANGVNMAAIQGVMKKMSKLEKKIDKVMEVA